MSTRNHRDPLNEQSLPDVDDLDDSEGPPIPEKEFPRNALSDAVPTLDDEVRNYHHHPNESGSIEFNADPAAADAAADLASELGSEFLESATSGQDLSDVVASHDDDEGDGALLLDDEL